MDVLREAWDLLAEGERPLGVYRQPMVFMGSDTGRCFWHDQSDNTPALLTEAAARDRLLVAVEGANLAAGMAHEMVDGRHVWGKFPDVYGSDEDRLAAAVAARRAERLGANVPYTQPHETPDGVRHPGFRGP